MSMTEHLTQDQIIMAAVDAADLEPSQRGHLDSCPHCLAELERLAGDLMDLGNSAREAVAVPPRSFKLPRPEPVHAVFEPESGSWLGRWWNRQGPLNLAGGLAMAAVLFLAVMIGLRSGGLPPAQSPVAHPDEVNLITAMAPMAPDQDALGYLLTEATVPLSPFHRFVIGGDDTVLDNEFMEFLAPEDGGDLTSLDRRSLG
jgi:hypothetical protein